MEITAKKCSEFAVSFAEIDVFLENPILDSHCFGTRGGLSKCFRRSRYGKCRQSLWCDCPESAERMQISNHDFIRFWWSGVSIKSQSMLHQTATSLSSYHLPTNSQSLMIGDRWQKRQWKSGLVEKGSNFDVCITVFAGLPVSLGFVNRPR